MAFPPRPGPFTFEDFITLFGEDQKADLINGTVYLSAPQRPDHNQLLGWLCVILGQLVRSRTLGHLTLQNVAYRLSDRTAPSPDVGVVLQAREGIIGRDYIDGPPDLAIEVVSADSVARDYELKQKQYEDAGVQEYWIIDPDERRATFLRLESGRFVEAPPTEQIFESRVLPGFRLDTRWFWQRPLPDTLPIVQALLTE